MRHLCAYTHTCNLFHGIDKSVYVIPLFNGNMKRINFLLQLNELNSLTCLRQEKVKIYYHNKNIYL